MSHWINGSPPVDDGGALVLVRLREGAYVEHHGDPIIASRWSSKLKATVEGVRIEYEDVLEWTPLPMWMR